MSTPIEIDADEKHTRQLVKWAVRGDGAAFTVLLDKFEKRIWNAIHKAKPKHKQDAYWACAAKLYEMARSFDENAGAKFSTWCHSALHFAAIDQYRSEEGERHEQQWDEDALDRLVDPKTVED